MIWIFCVIIGIICAILCVATGVFMVCVLLWELLTGRYNEEAIWTRQ